MTDAYKSSIISKSARKQSSLRTERAVNMAKRQGATIETLPKRNAAPNKQTTPNKNPSKLDRETEDFKHETIPLELGKLIQQGRHAKGMTQKDLALKICAKPNVINDYECGRGIPDNAVLGKIETVIGIKLRGKDRGKPIPAKGNKK